MRGACRRSCSRSQSRPARCHSSSRRRSRCAAQRAHADGTASLMPPVYCLRRGLRPKDGPGSARTAAVSIWLRWGRVARSRQCRRRRAPGRRGPRGLSRAPGLPPRTPMRMGSGRPRCFNPSPSYADAAGSSLHPESGRSRHARCVPMRWSTGGHHGYSRATTRHRSLA
jgi:hypothetical protein